MTHSGRSSAYLFIFSLFCFKNRDALRFPLFPTDADALFGNKPDRKPPATLTQTPRQTHQTDVLMNWNCCGFRNSSTPRGPRTLCHFSSLMSSLLASWICYTCRIISEVGRFSNDTASESQAILQPAHTRKSSIGSSVLEFCPAGVTWTACPFMLHFPSLVSRCRLCQLSNYDAIVLNSWCHFLSQFNSPLQPATTQSHIVRQ